MRPAAAPAYALLLPAVLLLGACGPRSTTATRAELDPALRGDLDRAAAPTADLATSRYRPLQTVSAVELGSAGMAIRPRAASARPGRAPAPRPVTAIAPAAVPQLALRAATAAPEPVVAQPVLPAPSAGAADAPTVSGGSGGIVGPTGVIIRGGHIGDDDHCEIHPPHGRVPVAVNRRVPLRPAFGGRGIW